MRRPSHDGIQMIINLRWKRLFYCKYAEYGCKRIDQPVEILYFRRKNFENTAYGKLIDLSICDVRSVLWY